MVCTATIPLCKRFGVPQVLGFIIVGLVFGNIGSSIFSVDQSVFHSISQFGLAIIGFGIGGELRFARLRRLGWNILCIAITESLLTVALVGIGVYLVTQNLPLSIMLGALAASTSPGGTTRVLQELRARGPVTSTLIGVIAADDAISVVIYAFAYTFTAALISESTAFSLLDCSEIIGGHLLFSLAISIVAGLILSQLIYRVRHEEMKHLLLISTLFVTVGISLHYDASIILSTMGLGMVVSNIRPHRSKSYFSLLNKLTPAILVVFFSLIGLQIDIGLIPELGGIGLIYCAARMIGKYFGARIGGSICSAPKNVREKLGFGLFSQAGIVIGLTLAAQHDLQLLSPQHQNLGRTLINVVTGTTVFFQIINPLFTRYAIKSSHEDLLKREQRFKTMEDSAC